MTFLKTLQQKLSDNFIFYSLLLFTFSGFLYILAHSPGTYDGGDGVTHYLISRFSFKHPELLLDLWGKPFFTLMSAPFAQFGLKGITFFNILCGFLSACCGFEIAKKLGMKFPWVIFCFSLFTPIYFGVLNSGLTEPFFSLMLIFCIMLLFKGRTYTAAIIFSLASFVRPEANYMIIIFILYFIVKKQYKAIPLLFSGTLLYTLIGGIYFQDLLWLKTNNPYNNANAEAYGNIESGVLFHYVKNYLHITGGPIGVLLVLGSLALFVNLFFKLRNKIELKADDHFIDEFILIYCCFFLYVVVHSVIWWLRLFPTLGLLRYMSSILPVAALICLRGLNFSFTPIKNKMLQLLILVPFLFIVIRTPFQEYFYPFVLDGEQAVVQKSADWIKNSPYKNAHIYPIHPYVKLALDLDPYDTKRPELMRVFNRKDPGENIPSESIIVWDAHYALNDHGIQLNSLLDSPDYKLLKVFKPEADFKVLGDVSFEVYLFERI